MGHQKLGSAAPVIFLRLVTLRGAGRGERKTGRGTGRARNEGWDGTIGPLDLERFWCLFVSKKTPNNAAMSSA